MVDSDTMVPGLQLVGARFSNFLPVKLSQEFKFRRMSIFHEIQMASYIVGRAGSPTRTVYVDVSLTRSKVKITGLLNFRQLAKPCMLAAMTAAPVAGLSGYHRGLLLNFLLSDVEVLRAKTILRKYTLSV